MGRRTNPYIQTLKGRAAVGALRLLGLLPYAEGPACWFEDHLPALRAAAAAGRLRMRECLQRAGELVYIPSGWHHAILNLELSCAIAQTLISPPTLRLAWPRLRQHWPAFAISLRAMLTHARPSLAAALKDDDAAPPRMSTATPSVPPGATSSTSSASSSCMAPA